MTDPMRTLGVRVGPELYARLETEAAKRSQLPSELARDLLAVELMPTDKYVEVATAKRRAKIGAYEAEIKRLEARVSVSLSAFDEIIRTLADAMKARAVTLTELAATVPLAQVAEKLLADKVKA
jgi:hypothetical protein